MSWGERTFLGKCFVGLKEVLGLRTGDGEVREDERSVIGTFIEKRKLGKSCLEQETGVLHAFIT